MTFHFLWTDICFLVFLSLGLVAVLLSLRRAHIRRALSQIIQRPLAVSAGIVLLFFLLIGIMDSIHYQTANSYSDTAQSVLDYVLAPIGSTYEKTYSAPLSLTSFVTDTQLVDGVATQVYPRLNYVPGYIKTDADKINVIQSILIKCFLYLLAFFITVAIVLFVLKKRYQCSINASAVAAIVTIGLLFFLAATSFCLSRYFHVLGTGQIGQDIFYFTLKSIRTGLIIGLLTTLFMLPLALFLGIAAGYFGGVIDDIIQYIYTTLSSIPGVLLITASVLSLQTYISNHPEQFTTLAKSADARLLALCMILGVTSWTSLCRLLRAETLKLREVDYIAAAHALGSSWFTIIRKHLLPNVMHIVIITLVLDFSFLVMAEAVLSY
ncbi:MAG: ABC transporter permease, partial [Legionella sp.]